MTLRSAIRRVVERLTGTRIYASAPRGIDLARDFADDLPAFRLEIVFDVGANVGQSARRFLRMNPRCRIHCFEPTSDTFHQLQRAVADSGRVECHRVALGAATGTGRMVIERSSEMNFLAAGSTEESVLDAAPAEPVDIVTLDAFCVARGIDRISFLKVDTEGGDLDVLRGAERLLAEQRIDVVQVEAGMNPGNERHVPFETLKAYLESHHYHLYGIYEQVGEWPLGEPQLRRTNPVFISGRTIAANRRPAPDAST